MNKKKILVRILLLIIIFFSVVFFFRDRIFYDVEGNLRPDPYTNCFFNDQKGTLQTNGSCKWDEGTACVFDWGRESGEFTIGVLKENECNPREPGSSCLIDKEMKGTVPTKKEFIRYKELCVERV